MSSKNYKVIGHIAILGVGTILKLSKLQANIRQNSLKEKSKDTYIVLEPVQFKQGEEITIISGNISKSLLANLCDLSQSLVESDNKQEKQSSKDSKPSTKSKNSNSGKKNGKKTNDKIDKKIITDNDINNLPNV